MMTVSCTIAVANLYYCQPLLTEMAETFEVTNEQMGLVSGLSQGGYAVGLLLFVPLGDVRERRRLIVVMLSAASAALVAIALAPNFLWLVTANLVLGLVTIASQLLVPFAATLAAPSERGRVVGMMIGGIVVGVLISRVFSGAVGDLLGWRTVYGIAAGLMAGLAVTLGAVLPRHAPTTAGLSYPQLLHSLATLIREERVLRIAALLGALVFAGMNGFWATLDFYLSGPAYGYKSRDVGLFGLLGAGAALVAPLVGQLTQRTRPGLPTGLGIGVMLGAFVLLWATGQWLGGLILGVVLLDAGVQVANVSNQARIYSLRPEATNRLNTVYMVACFAGSAAGASASSLAWGHWGWDGVCAVGVGLGLAGLLVFLLGAARRSDRATVTQSP
jgi:predicted MFS family arabinose efflux permease